MFVSAALFFLFSIFIVQFLALLDPPRPHYGTAQIVSPFHLLLKVVSQLSCLYHCFLDIGAILCWRLEISHCLLWIDPVLLDLGVINLMIFHVHFVANDDQRHLDWLSRVGGRVLLQIDVWIIEQLPPLFHTFVTFLIRQIEHNNATISASVKLGA